MIPHLLLEEINAGEKNAKDYYGKYGKEELEKALADLRKSDEEIFAAYPVKDMEKQFEEKISDVAKPKNNVFSFKSYRMWTMSAAAVLAVFVCVPLMYNVLKSGNSSDIRVKGNGTFENSLRLYKQEGNKIIKLSDGDTAKENDVIQITYVPGSKNYGVTFSIDGNGNITRHFPDENWSAGKLEKTGDEVPPSFSYALDNAPEYECFVFVASEKPFTLNKVKDIADGKKSIKKVEQLKKGRFFPRNTSAEYFVLEK